MSTCRRCLKLHFVESLIVLCYKCSNVFFVILHLKILLPCHGSDPSSHESNNYLCYSKLHFVESLVIPCYKCSIGLFVIFKFKFKKPQNLIQNCEKLIDLIQLTLINFNPQLEMKSIQFHQLIHTCKLADDFKIL